MIRVDKPNEWNFHYYYVDRHQGRKYVSIIDYPGVIFPFYYVEIVLFRSLRMTRLFRILRTIKRENRNQEIIFYIFIQLNFQHCLEPNCVRLYIRHIGVA